MILGDIKLWVYKEHLQVVNLLLMLCKNLDFLIVLKFRQPSLHQEMYTNWIYSIWNFKNQTYVTRPIFIYVIANF
jgi:hypothetical protein